ncbi:hypothetical protein GSI_02346 [Ganoderma sinense ZZ0214-1]|uniref:Uncharacterized protein n=1 Tax=Ganoderma sinense ZZ0214-1 TaxID=1077348 RepID=A0A2G8SPW7_9APHY|nr:hypothetical protein GSI_02346 [Ganoderma sinense ZZ0214-1]
MFIVVVSLSAITIAAISFASLLLSFVGATLLGLPKASGHLYADVTVISLVVATACGAAIIAAACAALVLVLMPLLICDYDVVVCSCCVVLSGGMITAFFAPAIGIAVTKGHVVGQSIELTAREAMKMNGVGLGGVLACGLALYMCTIGFMGALFSS